MERTDSLSADSGVLRVSFIFNEEWFAKLLFFFSIFVLKYILNIFLLPFFATCVLV